MAGVDRLDGHTGCTTAGVSWSPSTITDAPVCTDVIEEGEGLFEVVYYESIKRELKTRPTYECRCDERLKTKTEESTRTVYTGLFGELEHLKIETRLIDERFSSVMGEYVFLEKLE
jgi:hypothetical protein